VLLYVRMVQSPSFWSNEHAETFLQGVWRQGRAPGTRHLPLIPQLSPTLDRFVLAATEHLHKRIAKMKDRIRQLEDALAILHAKGSNEPHPLLRDDVLAAENAEQDLDDDVMVAQQPPPTSNIIDAFGTLSVSEHGISRFFGPTGGSEASRCNYSR
jgi:hypothetical protein